MDRNLDGQSPFYPVTDNHPFAEEALLINQVVDRAMKSSPWLEADQLRQLRLLGWLTLTDTLAGTNRQAVVAQSRLLSRKDPMGRNSARIWEAYTVGDGLQWSVENSSKGSANAKLLKAFWESPRNRAALQFLAQRRAYRALLDDGELHYILFFGALGTTPVIRMLTDSTEFLDPVTHPEDRSTVLYYVRQYSPMHWEFASGQPQAVIGQTVEYQYIRSWEADEETIREAGVSVPSASLLKRAVGIRLTINEVGQRGYPMNEASLDWLRTFKGFMEDRVTISRALSRFAWRLTGSATEDQLRTIMSGLENFSPDADIKRGQGVAKIFASNDNVKMDPIRPSSGGADALSDARLIRQMVGSGVGITEPNLTGDPSVGNLASLTAMDGVMARNFQTDQNLLKDFWRDIFSAVLTRGQLDSVSIGASIAWTKKSMAVDYPPVVTEDAETLVIAVTTAAPSLPPNWVTRKLLQVLGEDNPDQVMDEWELEKAEQAVPPAPVPSSPPENVPDGTTGDGDSPTAPESFSTESRRFATGIPTEVLASVIAHYEAQAEENSVKPEALAGIITTAMLEAVAKMPSPVVHVAAPTVSVEAAQAPAIDLTGLSERIASAVSQALADNRPVIHVAAPNLPPQLDVEALAKVISEAIERIPVPTIEVSPTPIKIVQQPMIDTREEEREIIRNKAGEIVSTHVDVQYHYKEPTDSEKG